MSLCFALLSATRKQSCNRRRELLSSSHGFASSILSAWSKAVCTTPPLLCVKKCSTNIGAEQRVEREWKYMLLRRCFLVLV